METGVEIKEDQELVNLIDKVVVGFDTVVAKEDDLSNILLKGHLLIENLLEELIAVFDLNKKISIHRLTFSDKLKRLNEFSEKHKNDYISSLIKEVLPIIYAINQVRNDLAHDYNFSISESTIDKIGVNLGSKFILNKYNKGRNQLKENLLFCLKETIVEIGRVMYHKICNLRDKAQKLNKN